MSFSLIGGKKHKKSRSRKGRKVHKGGDKTTPFQPASYTMGGGRKKSRRKASRKSSRKRRGGLAKVAVPGSLLVLRRLLKGSLKHHKSRKHRKSRGRK